MASSCQQSEWLRVGVLAATVAQPHCKKPIDPVKIIPQQYRPRFQSRLVDKPQAVVDHESPRAWAALNRFFTQAAARGEGGKPKTYVIRVGGK